MPARSPGTGTSRRRFLTASGIAVVGGAGTLTGAGEAHGAPTASPARGGHHEGEPVDEAVAPGELDQVASTFFSTAIVQSTGTVAAKGSDGDLWPSC
ncbi:MAG: twin-arginine translocation signal domain-containing protein [Nocardioidaceae bacterium]